jgi:ligand-binding SRPBCC domain-containing protein
MKAPIPGIAVGYIVAACRPPPRSPSKRGPGMRFLERSTLFSMRAWQHEREVVPDGRVCTVTDRLTFELRRPLDRAPGLRRLSRVIVAWLFRHRHRRLAKQFGAGG